MSIPPLKGVVLDVDGTLVDSNYAHVRCWREALHQGGHDVPSATIHRAIGKPSAGLLDEVLGPERDKAKDEELVAAHAVLYGEQQPLLRLLPGARELLRTCADLGLVVALASSASKDEAKALRELLEADDVIAAMTTADDVESGKPEPDPIGVALDRISLDAEYAVFIGDSVWDVIAATRVPIRFIGVCSGGIAACELWAAGAREIYDGPRQLLDDLARLVNEAGGVDVG